MTSPAFTHAICIYARARGVHANLQTAQGGPEKWIEKCVKSIVKR